MGELNMKRQLYYRLAQMRRWANTDRGEHAIVCFFSVLSVIAVVDITLLVIGSI